MLRTSLLTLLSLTLCAQDAKPAAKAEAKAAPKVEAKAAPAKVEDKIIGRVGDHFVRASDVDAAIAALPPQQQQQVMMVQGGREMYTKSFVEMQLLAAKARLNGADKTEAFKRKAQSAMNQLLATELLQKEGPALQEKMKLKEEDFKAYYEANKAKFMSVAKFSARHILIGVKSDRNPTWGTEEEAKAKIAKIQEALKGGKKLEELAKEFSDDPGSKDKGGLYEDIEYGKFVPEFEKAVKEQELGKPGEAVKTAFGYHIIQAEKRSTPEQETFEAAKEKVTQAATQARQEQVWNAFLGELKKDVPFQFGGEISESSAKPAKALKVAKAGAKKPAAGAAK